MSVPTVDVFAQRELVELLADEPELLAIADAIAETRPVARPLRSRRLLVTVAAACAVLLIVGAALAATLGGFSGWLTGTPGAPASPAEQAAFAAANAHSFAAFPANTRLHDLIVERVGGATYRLSGFRSGDELCLRLTASGIDGEPAMSCIPRIALERAKAPAQVALIDWDFGPVKQIGSHHVAPPVASVSFGFVADHVASVDLVAGGSPAHATVAHDAFLAVRLHPTIGSHVRQVFAVDSKGKRIAVPFAPPSMGLPGQFRPLKTAPLPGPKHVQRTVKPGTIGWVNRQQPRGQSLTQAGVKASRLYGSHSFGIRFARVIHPDPQSNIGVIVYTIGKRHNLCIETDTSTGGGGGCSIHFPTPLNGTLGGASDGDQFTMLTGLASDAVASIDLFLADGERWPVALKDNTYLVQAPRDRFPVTLVAYDDRGRIIGINPWRDF